MKIKLRWIKIKKINGDCLCLAMDAELKENELKMRKDMYE